MRRSGNLPEKPASGQAYLRNRLQGKQVELTPEPGPEGAVTIHALVDGMMEKYVFTPL